jgi:hypothetical protein
MSLYYSGTNCSFSNSSVFTSSESEVLVSSSDKKKPVLTLVSSKPRERRTVFIRDLADERVMLRSSLPVTVESDGASVTVFSVDTGDFSVGADEIGALDEFRASVVDLYFMLKEESGNLGPLPQRHWNFLSSIIQER